MMQFLLQIWKNGDGKISFVDRSVKTLLSQLATSFCCTTPRSALQDEKLEFSFRAERFLFGIQTELRRKTAKFKSNDRRFKGRTTLIRPLVRDSHQP
jgi:hypothetical protein